jgi:hypothetical protein
MNGLLQHDSHFFLVFWGEAVRGEGIADSTSLFCPNGNARSKLGAVKQYRPARGVGCCVRARHEDMSQDTTSAHTHTHTQGCETGD